MTSPKPAPALRVVIGGGGVAGLEGLLALHALAGDRVRLTLVAPEPDFSYRPLAVAEPFAHGRAERVPLETLARETGAELIRDAIAGIDDAAGEVRLASGGMLPYDALLLAPGARPVDGVPGATTWWPGGDPEALGGLLRDIEEGYTKRVAFVIPPGAVWPLPAYELALMTAAEARAMGHDDVTITVVTPEHTPLSLFGAEASAAVAEELAAAAVALEAGAVARVAPGGLVLQPAGRELAVERIVAVPRVLGPALDGLPADEEGFIRAGDDAQVEGCTRTWAAGDGVVSPVKFGGLATHQARRAAAAIARRAGAGDAPDPGEPMLVGRLLAGDRSRRLIRRADIDRRPLWWPAGKVVGEYLPRWLAEHGAAPAEPAEPPARGVTIRRPLSTLRGPEAQYLYELARQFRTPDPELAALGRRLRAQ
jgi:sulfide:quinone oxidoreductase